MLVKRFPGVRLWAGKTNTKGTKENQKEVNNQMHFAMCRVIACVSHKLPISFS